MLDDGPVSHTCSGLRLSLHLGLKMYLQHLTPLLIGEMVGVWPKPMALYADSAVMNMDDWLIGCWG